jgi:hypothetical protein
MTVKTGDATEVAEIAGQHLVAERKRRCSDQQVPERNHHASALLLSVDFAGQQRGFFCVWIDRQIGQQFIYYKNDSRRRRISGV